MTSKSFIQILSFFLLLSAQTFAATETAQEIVQKVLDTRAQGFETVNVEMKISDAAGANKVEPRTFTIVTVSQGRDSFKSLVSFKDPAGLKGAKVLTLLSNQQSGQWIYLPSSKRTTRVNSGSETDGIFDSDLSLADLKGESLDDFNYAFGDKSLAEYAAKQCNEPSYAIVATPKGTQAKGAFQKRLLSVSQTKLVVCDVLAYGATGNVLKRIQNLDLKDYKGKWRPNQTIITSFNKMKKAISKTTINYYGWSQGKNADTSIFSPETLDR